MSQPADCRNALCRLREWSKAIRRKIRLTPSCPWVTCVSLDPPNSSSDPKKISYLTRVHQTKMLWLKNLAKFASVVWSNANEDVLQPVNFIPCIFITDMHSISPTNMYNLIKFSANDTLGLPLEGREGREKERDWS